MDVNIFYLFMMDETLNIFSEKEKACLREDWKSFQTVLKQNGVRCLFHITDSKNIDSIYKAKALLSKNEQVKRDIFPTRKGGNDLSDSLEEKKGLVNYVHLAFTSNLPMFSSSQRSTRSNPIVTPVALEIDPRIILLKFSKFSNINALDNSAQIGSELEDLERVNFDLIKRVRWSTDQERKEMQAEILVQNFVPIKYIKKMYRI